MARVRLLQLHQEQQQHVPGAVDSHQPGGTTVVTSATNQWLDLVPSNPILPQIALPGTPLANATAAHPHLQHRDMIHSPHNHQDENGGSSSTESAHQARSGGLRHSQPSKIPVVKSSYSAAASSRPASSYREPHHHRDHGRDSYQSWNNKSSDLQSSLPRYWEPINNPNRSGGSSIVSGGKQQQQHHRSRKDSANGGGGGTSLTRARSQNHHLQRNGVVAAVAKDSSRACTTGGGTTVTASHQLTATADDTNKVRPTKRFANIINSWIRKS